ncbi:MAG: hypothetical protein NWF07_13445 [Candidatus Bathyarchaeota archaeon]|nr:hypothetical protein [Candidatus Bathyarchaeota archaeon]
MSLNKKILGIVLLSTILASMTIPMIAAPNRIAHDHIGVEPDYVVKQPLDGGDKSLRTPPNEYIWSLLIEISNHLAEIFSAKLAK